MIFRYKIKFISDIEQKIRKLLVNIAVTPFVGVWIEIVDDRTGDQITQSLPSWECGLKYQPYLYRSIRNVSLPSWECGLKYQTGNRRYFDSIVTPFVGVWIEIARLLLLQKVQTVTPFVGVWIEMFPIFSSKFFKYSHSLRGSVD